MPQVDPAIETFALIKVVGVGGAGGAAINRMVDAGVSGVDFIAVNTDAQALHNSKAKQQVHIGAQTTRGLGAGADPDLGEKSAVESEEEVRKVIKDADMVFVTFGAGGGTGSGAGPVVAKLAQESDALVVGFATKPFAFEGEKRRRNADTAIEKLRQNVDTLITVPNDKLLQTIDRRTPLMEAFKVADDVLRQGVQGISDLITVNGLVNLDFADVKAIMKNSGSALMGIGRASGENRAVDAAQQAISSPLLEVSIDGARGILFNVIGGPDMSMHEINSVAETITAAADSEANIIFGATINPDLEGEIIVTVVATGFDDSYFATRDHKAASLFKSATSGPSSTPTHQVDDETMASIDMELKDEADTDHVHEFHKEEDTPNIWALSDNETTDQSDTADEDELEKPSFLRRFTSMRGKAKTDDDDDEQDENKYDEDKRDDDETKDLEKDTDQDDKSESEKPKKSKKK